MKIILPLLVAASLAGVLVWSMTIKPDPACVGCAAADQSFTMDAVAPGTPYPKIPGDPQNAVKAFRNIYKALIGYRKEHGHLPKRTKVLLDLSKPIAKGVQLSKSDLVCVDALLPEYALSAPRQPNEKYFLTWRGRRPDGTRRPLVPRPGERDLWALSNHYERVRAVKRGDFINMEGYGVVVGLFSDGTIAVTPVQEMVAVRRGSNAWQTFFPIETGVPAGARPYNVVANEVKRGFESKK